MSAAEDTSFILVAEITRAVDDQGTLQTEYVSSGRGFVTRPTDTPANTPVWPTLSNPGSLRREMFSGAKPFGRVQSSYGEVRLINLERRYDGWTRDGFDGRSYVLRRGPVGGAYPADFPVVLRCTFAGKPAITAREVVFKLRDNTVLLERSMLKDTFQGGSMADGGSLLMGQAKRRYIGTPEWLGPAPVAVADGWGKIIYHISTGQLGTMLLYDNGNPLEQVWGLSNFWDFASEQQPGTFWQYYENGSTYARLGTRPVGDLRPYGTGFQNDGSRWTMAALLAELGYEGQIMGPDLPNLNAIIADSGITYARLFDDAAATAGMCYGFDRLGRFSTQKFEEPGGLPVIALGRRNCLSVEHTPVPGMEAPLFKLGVNATQTWASRYTAPVNWVRHKFEATEWLYKFTYSREQTLVKHPNATELQMDLLVGPTTGMEWADFCDRYLSMFGVDRCCFTVQVPLDDDTLQLDLGQTVQLFWDRFDLSGGVLFRIISIRYLLQQQRLELLLWG